MTNNSLDKLPPETLSTIVDLIEDESGWREYPTETLLSLRLTCKTLEQACHKRFLLYFYEWSIDLDKEKDLSTTKAVLASRVHKAAIKRITFVYRGVKPSLWQVAPLLHEVLGCLISLNRGLILGFDPFGYPEQGDGRSTENVLEFIRMILIIVATSKLMVNSIRIQARREDWDAHDRFSENAHFSLDEPHYAFAEVDHGEILAELHEMLSIERHNFRQGPPSELIAEFPGIGDISFNYVQGSLRIQGLEVFHWHEFGGWLESIRYNSIEISRCGLNPPELGRILSWAHITNHPVRALSIVDTRLLSGIARVDDKLSATCLHRLMQAIVPYAQHFEYIHFANIWGDGKIDPWPAFDTDQGGLELRGKDKIRSHLYQLSDQFVEETDEEDESSHDDEESDTS
ncbi:hypothetical protein KCU65_g909, partial [Aureobasidium melanogenum]